jgi:hypothetical protein
LKPTAEEFGSLDFVRRLLNDSMPASGTLAQTYLRSRGIGIVLPVLRFAPSLRHTPSGKTFPALVVPVVDVEAELMGAHRTFLAPDGSGKAAVAPNRMMLGRIIGGAARLAEAGREIGLGDVSFPDLRGIASMLPAGEAAPEAWGNTALTIIDHPAPWQVRLLNCIAHLDDLEVRPLQDSGAV